MHKLWKKGKNISKFLTCLPVPKQTKLIIEISFRGLLCLISEKGGSARTNTKTSGLKGKISVLECVQSRCRCLHSDTCDVISDVITDVIGRSSVNVNKHSSSADRLNSLIFIDNNKYTGKISFCLCITLFIV